MVSGPRGQGGRDPRPNAMDNYYGFGRGLDVRNPGDFALQRAQSYPSNRQPLLNQPPMEGPPQSQQRPHVNPRMRGMGGGGGGLESLQSKVNLQEIMDKMPWMNPYRIIKGLESHGVEYAENDPFDPSRLGIGDPFNNQIFTDPFDPRRLGIEEEPYDPFNNQLGENPGTETQVAEMGGYGYNPGPKSYDDIYEGLDIIDMEVLPGEGYGPSDEYDYDRKRGYPGYIYDSPPSYAARGGLMSLRR